MQQLIYVRSVLMLLFFLATQSSKLPSFARIYAKTLCETNNFAVLHCFPILLSFRAALTSPGLEPKRFLWLWSSFLWCYLPNELLRPVAVFLRCFVSELLELPSPETEFSMHSCSCDPATLLLPSRANHKYTNSQTHNFNLIYTEGIVPWFEKQFWISRQTELLILDVFRLQPWKHKLPNNKRRYR
jgi:hypothetical protein